MPKSTPNIDKFPFIEAHAWETPDSDDHVLEVLASTALKATSEKRYPVRDYLASHCSCEVHREKIKDATWMFGSYIWTKYLVFKVCPGECVSHDCVQVMATATKGGMNG